MGEIAGFRGEVLGPADPRYDEARALWNGAIDRRPGLIARCGGTADAAAALRHAREHGLEVSIRSGGHGVAGLAAADGGLMIDLSRMKGIHVDPERRRVRVQAGVVLGDIDHETQAYGLAVPVGIASTTGLAGLTLGGGIGWLMRRHGLTIDNLASVELVTAAGELVRASQEENAELFWGIRGAGTNFGIVTSLEYRAHQLGPVVLAGLILWAMEDAPEVLRAYRDFCEGAPDDVTTIAWLRVAPPASWLPQELHRRPVLWIAACHADPADQGEDALRRLRSIRRPLLDLVAPRPFLELQSLFDPAVPKGWHYYWKSHDLPPLKDDVIDLVVEHSTRITSPRSYSLIFHLEGAVSRVSEEATAYSHREAAHSININGVWLPGDPEPEAHIAWTREMSDALEPYAAGVYVNFLGQEGQERVRAAYGSDKYERLAKLKARWDAENLLHLNQNIKPLGSPPQR